MTPRCATLLVALLASTATAADWGSFDQTRVPLPDDLLPTSGYYFDLRQKIALAGGTVANPTGTVTSSYLASKEVFYAAGMGAISGVLSTAEQDALEEWVKCGGTLVVATGYVTIAANDSLLARFGITTASNGSSGTATTHTSHALVSGVGTLLYSGVTDLVPAAGSEVLMKTAESLPFLIVLENTPAVGAGRVMVMGYRVPLMGSLGGGAGQFRQNLSLWAEIPPGPLCSNVTASWSTYGPGWPGTNGVPKLQLDKAPKLDAEVKLTLENSSGKVTSALFVFGKAPVNLKSDLGGSLLVLPAVQALVPLPAGGIGVVERIPCDTTLCGAHLYLQVLQVDKNASHGVSFTRGLAMTFGN